MAQKRGMNKMTKRKRENVKHQFTDGNPEWAFNKETTEQLKAIAKHYEKKGFCVETIVLWNDHWKNLDKNDLTLEEYQDCIEGLSVLAHKDDGDRDGNYYKVVIETYAKDDSIHVLAGFGNDGNKELWNSGLFYHKGFSKDELGKFSALCDRIETNLFSLDKITPITLPITNKQGKRVKSGGRDTMSRQFEEFVEAALGDGVVKRIRPHDTYDVESD